MELIAAVYDNWGIGAGGTQPIALSADRRFFRETTKGAAVIVGRRTVEDFPGQKPLPGRKNILLTRRGGDFPGFTVCQDVTQALEAAADAQRVMVIGGGSIYDQLLPYCTGAYITKVHTTIPCDTFLPNLDQDPAWELQQILMEGTEDGVDYQICRYERIK
jgi:dihydrofolate reductase